MVVLFVDDGSVIDSSIQFLPSPRALPAIVVASATLVAAWPWSCAHSVALKAAVLELPEVCLFL